MIAKAKTSLGIDISDSRVSFALVKERKGQISLLKAGFAPIETGVITDGNVTDAASLAAAIRQLLKSNKIHLRHAVVSLVARPTLTQIIDLPEEVPANIGQFVRSEIKHSAVLAGKNPQYDFCGLASEHGKGIERVLVAATDHEKVVNFLNALKLAGIDPVSIELPAAAAIRAIYNKKISEKYESNVLVAIIGEHVINICVFKKGTFHFIRRIETSFDDTSEEYISQLADEIDAVIQFYDIEINNSLDNKWDIIVVNNNSHLEVSDIEFFLEKKFGSKIEICSDKTVYSDTVLAENEKISSASIGAVGLALKDAEDIALNINIDLIPPEAEEAKAAKKFALVTSNIAAIVLLGVFIFAGIVSMQLNKTQDAMAERKANDSTSNIEKLLRQQGSGNNQLEQLRAKKEGMSAVFGDSSFNAWAEILDDIRKKTPQTVCISAMKKSSQSNLNIHGNSLSYKSIHLFGELLGQSEYIASASVNETTRSSRVEGLIEYVIECVLISDKETESNVE